MKLNQLTRTLVAFDALKYHATAAQFSESNVARELNKAYAAFFRERDETAPSRGIATSSWGCGGACMREQERECVYDFVLLLLLLLLHCGLTRCSIWRQCVLKISHSMDGGQRDGSRAGAVYDIR